MYYEYKLNKSRAFMGKVRIGKMKHAHNYSRLQTGNQNKHLLQNYLIRCHKTSDYIQTVSLICYYSGMNFMWFINNFLVFFQKWKCLAHSKSKHILYTQCVAFNS